MRSDGLAKWSERPLYDLAEYINGRATKPREVVHDGVPIIKIAELNRGITVATDRVPGECVEERHWVRDGDLLFAWSGSVGIHVYRGAPAAFNQHIFRVTAKPGCDQRFLRYLLAAQLPVFEQFVASKRTTMGHVTVADLRRTRVLVPPRADQKRIASVLGALDDKIESNRRLAGALEETAATMFRARFVDFFGVDEFDESEIGQIPRGWRVASLDEVTETTIGGLWGVDAPSENAAIPVRCLRGIDVHALASGEVPEPPIRYVSASQLEKRRLAARDILVEGSGSYCGRSGLFNQGWQDLYAEELIYSNFCKRLRPHGRLGQAEIAWFHLKAAYGSGRTAQFRTGSAFPNLDLAGLSRAIKFAAPPPGETPDFWAVVELANATTLRLESRTLAAVRDALLPKLISGAIRVPDTADPAEVIEPAVLQVAAGSP